MAQGKNQWVKPLANAISLGTAMVAAIALPTWIGYKLDERYGTGMLWMLVGLFFGMLTCGKMVWERLMKSDESEEDIPVYRKKTTDRPVQDNAKAKDDEEDIKKDKMDAEEDEEGDPSSWW